MVLLLLSGAAGLVAIQRIDHDLQRTEISQQFEKQGVAGDELKDRTNKAMNITQRFAPVLAVVGVVFAVVFYLLVALGLWLALRLAGGEITFKQGFSATLHAMVPTGLKALVLIPVLFVVSPVDPQVLRAGTVLGSNLGFLAPEGASHALVALLTSADVFSLWTVALLVLGLSVVARVSKSTSALVVVVGWAVLVGLKVGLWSLFG